MTDQDASQAQGEVEPDAFGNEGERLDCGCCSGRGTYWAETCFRCGGFGWYREPAPGATAQDGVDGAEAIERVKAYIAELLLALQPFASAAERAAAENAARQGPSYDGPTVFPWNYVNPSHFADAFAIYSDRLDPADLVTPTPTIPAGMVADAAQEALDEACALIQEAKGFAGPGDITDHLDFAESWLNKIDLASLAAAPKQAEPQGVERNTVAFVQEWLMSSDHAPTQWDREFAAAIEARAAGVTHALVAQMVSRFLAWKMPADFNPDGGISFKNVFGQHWPVGTNLFTAAQAEEMVRNMLAALNAPTGVVEKGEG